MEETEDSGRKAGDNLVRTSVRKNRLIELLASWKPLTQGVPEVEDTPPQVRNGLQ